MLKVIYHFKKHIKIYISKVLYRNKEFLLIVFIFNKLILCVVWKDKKIYLSRFIYQNISKKNSTYSFAYNKTFNINDGVHRL